MTVPMFHLSSNRGFDPARAAVAAAAVCLLLAGACGGYPGGGRPEVLAGDMEIISRGEEVDLTAHLASGKYTLFDFYADWCPPCWAIEHDLVRLASESTNVAVRKINIIDWTTPVVRQHGVEELPHLLLYDSSGTFIASDDEALERARSVALARPAPESPKAAGGSL